MQSAGICSAKSSAAKLDSSVSETGGSDFFRSLDDLGETMTTGLDWRIPWYVI
jgi:hypothetical protein